MGVDIEIVKAGDGQSYPRQGQRVTVHYTGKLTNGKVFDSSVQKNRPFTFKLGAGEVIRGWDEGVAKMSLGEKSMLTLTPDYAYGNEDVGGGLIPANSTLVFEVELLSFQ